MIKISTLAKSKIIDTIKQNNGKSMYLFLKGGGCNGFSYKFKVLNDDIKPNKLDEIFKIDDYNLYLCNNSLMFLLGTEIDYIQDVKAIEKTRKD